MSDQSYYKKTPNKEIALTSKKLTKILQRQKLDMAAATGGMLANVFFDY